MNDQQLRHLLDLLEHLVRHAEIHVASTPAAAMGTPMVATARRTLDEFRKAMAKC